ASGVSDPAQIVLTFNRSFLRNSVRIDSIIAMVDTEQFMNIYKNPERLLREQVRVSDIVILNKLDLVDDKTKARAYDLINDIIDKARILEATYADVPIETIIGMNTYNPQTAFDTGGHGVHAHDVDELYDHDHSDHSLVFATWAWETDKSLNLQKIRAVLDDLPKSIFRAKGVIYASETPDTQVVLQLVGKRVALTQGDPWGDKTPNTSIVLIGDVGSVDKMLLTQQFEETIASDDSANPEMSQLVDGVLKWLRMK
ncbi:MAG: GTP-binding protein, partial [Chloroflexota bacterium]